MSDNQSVKVYLSHCSSQEESLRNELAAVLQRAGMLLVSENQQLESINEHFISSSLSKSNCSVHILFPTYTVLAKEQFIAAKKHLLLNPNFKIFVWLPSSTDFFNTDAEQLHFINEVKNNIAKNMMFSNASSPIQLVDDIRSAMETKSVVSFDLNSTDIFMMSNQLDEAEANEIIDLLSDIVPVEKLNIIQDSETDYSELCKQQIPKSRLAVIYFKESADWALPFAQQVWKKIGGATSHTPILLIGDTDPDSNTNKKFSAPKVISLIVEGALIPLEIKVQYDKVTSNPS
ncbi:MAG: hypothetical protein WBM13_03720 [Bacteroidia bacterium]